MPEQVRRRSAVWALLGAVTLALVGPGLGGVARADQGDGASGQSTKDAVTFGISPAVDGKPDFTRTAFSISATPGGLVMDQAAVVNYSTKPLRLTVYATDAINTPTGGFGLLGGGEEPTDAGSWVTIKDSGRPLTVPAAGEKGPGYIVLPVTVDVPGNASPGDHTAGLLAVLTAKGDGGRNSPAVTLEQRVGARLYVTVAGDARPAVTVSDVSVDYHGALNPLSAGTATVSYTVANSGNLNLAVTGSTTVSGLVAGSDAVAPEIPLLLPGSAVQQQVTVDDVWPQLLMKATVTLTPQAVATAAPPVVPVASASASFLAVPWLLLLLLLLLVVVGYLIHRRRRPKTGKGRRAKPRGGGGRGRRRAGDASRASHKLEGVGA